ncbi:MAG: Fe-S cluster assembly sulfur transfer protein SufU [Gammaproteobacteria bacterium]|jgi:nitrogen fixation NifU-like protein
MNHLRELYQEVIIEHGSNPRHFCKLEDPSCTGHGFNPLCGDHITLELKINNNTITEMGFQGQGCAISVASASLMCESLTGKSIQEAESAFELFHGILTTDAEPDERLGKLAVLSGVREFPARVKCATLAWHTLQNALAHNETPASTE